MVNSDVVYEHYGYDGLNKDIPNISKAPSFSTAYIYMQIKVKSCQFNKKGGSAFKVTKVN